ncbi:baseplate J/gp47 family protein [Serratia symbiotica]|uniref:baseplate J/gp47 family protein n=1 Tax=Serratia symbiotica TaxID=138074 RepID=UPI002090F19A|nr:baseplate J/gp47 family protein [Serratia symbiotica]
MLIAPEGIDSDVTILHMTGGTDDEKKDASLLVRLLEVIRRPAAGGNKYDYHRCAVEVPGVTEAYVYPLRRGYGAVDVVIAANNSMPSEDTIKAVQAHIDEERPVTAKNTLALAPEEVITDVSVKVKLSELSLDEAKKQIRAAITDCFNRLAPGDIAVLKQIGGSITNIVGVIDYNFIKPTGNIVPVVDKTRVQWIRLGTVAVDNLS